MTKAPQQQVRRHDGMHLVVIRYEPIDPATEFAAAVLEAVRQSELPTIQL